MNKLIFIVISLFILGCQATHEEIQDPGFGTCPQANGCECDTSETCPEYSECTQLFRGKYCVPIEGATVPQFKGIDQFGNEFDLYDLANKGKPILLEIGSAYPSACKHFSAWRSHISDEAKQQKWWKTKFERVRDLIDNQDIYWVHIIHLDENKNPATSETARLWHKNYPHNNITVLPDPEAKMKTWVRPTGLPCIILIDDNMKIQQHALRGIEDAIDAVYQILDSK